MYESFFGICKNSNKKNQCRIIFNIQGFNGIVRDREYVGSNSGIKEIFAGWEIQ